MAEVLITGVSGFVGHFAFERLKKDFRVAGTSRRTGECVNYIADITHRSEVDNMIRRASPEVLLHCAKIDKSVDYCEENKEECYSVNTLGTENLIDAMSKNVPDAKFIFLSTDYVYDGMRGSYTENDMANPIDYYGYSKLMAENYVRQLDNYLILRTTVVFGYHRGGNNFFMQLLTKQEKKEEMLVPHDQINNPSYIHLIIDLIKRSIEKDLRGIYVATGPEPLSRYNFALRIAESMEFDKKLIKPVSTQQLNQKAPRPLNCSTDPKKIQNVLGYKFPSLDESLAHLKVELENSTRIG